MFALHCEGYTIQCDGFLLDIDSIEKNTTSTEGRGKIGGRLLNVYKDSHVDNAGVLFVADCQPGTALCQQAGEWVWFVLPCLWSLN